MSDYEDFESKLSLVIRKPQEGKTFICISNIVIDKKSIHIVMTMNTLSAGMQFFGRMEERVGSKNIIVFNSKKETAGNCLYAKTVADVHSLLLSNPKINVIVCCAHTERLRESIVKLIHIASDSVSFINSKRQFTIHIDEAHKYIAENQHYVRIYNESTVVNSIIGYSGTPDGIWNKDKRDPLFHKILIRDVESELQIIRSPDYFGVNRCEFHILEEEMTHASIVSSASINNPNVSQRVIVRSDMKEHNRKIWYDSSYPFDLGNEILYLSYISLIIPRMRISADSFSYHFIPAYTRKVTQYETVEIVLTHCPNANVIVMNGNGTDLYRINPSDKKSYRVKSGNQILQTVSMEKRKKLGEPSYMIEELIKDTPNCPTFVTGFTCVGMSVTLINETIGNFDNVIMAHQHYSRAKLYQLCRFLFNYTNWSANGKFNIKTTQFYSLTKSVIDTCLEYEEHVENMNEFAGRICSLREIQGLAPEEPSQRELRQSALESIKLVNPGNKIWKKFKVYDGNDIEIWKNVELFYESIMGKKLSEKSKSRPKRVDGFYHCSTTAGVAKQSIRDVSSLEKQNWRATFQLTSSSLSYTRIFIGYDDPDDPSEYTIFVKFAQLEDSETNKDILQKYGKKSKKCTETEVAESSSGQKNTDTSSSDDDMSE
jgi:hypothetical protein